jgi:hypothetical protein
MAPEPEHEPVPDAAPTDAASEPTADESEATGLPAPTALESLVNALLEAGPDVAEHVVRAAQELLLAAQAVIDAADRAVAEQHGVRTAADTDDTGGATVHAIDRNE